MNKIIVAIPIVNGPLQYREEADGLHVAGWRSAANYDGKPAPPMNTASTCQDDVTRLPNDGDGSHTGNHEPTPKRAKKEDRHAMNDTKDNPSNDDDRKPAAKMTTPTHQDCAPSTSPGFKQESTSAHTESVVSTSGPGIKREPTPKTETAPVPASANTSTDQAEASIPTEPVINGPNLNRTVTVRRKDAKCTDPLYIAPPPQNILVPLSPSPTPQAEDIPVRKKPRVEEPLPTITDNVARKTASPDISEGLPTPVTLPSPDTVDVSTRRRSRRQIQLPPIETIEAELDDDADYVHGDGDVPRPSWEDRLSELADYRRIHEHCNVPQRCSENIKLGTWVRTQRNQYRLHLQGNKSFMMLSHIQKLERLGFEWDSNGAVWEDRLSELADYHKLHGHCNVPRNYGENTKLGMWVGYQRYQYKLHLEGKASAMTLSRIQELEILGFEWGSYTAAWEDRLSELAAYRRIHGHCNVPQKYSEITQLANWVGYQRYQYKLHLEGKASAMTLSRIQELEILGFEWDSQSAAWEDCLASLPTIANFMGTATFLNATAKVSS